MTRTVLSAVLTLLVYLALTDPPSQRIMGDDARPIAWEVSAPRPPSAWGGGGGGGTGTVTMTTICGTTGGGVPLPGQCVVVPVVTSVATGGR
jgi:hypothetical protein